jgi:4'-phosphopantetheinyl transferase EntD
MMGDLPVHAVLLELRREGYEASGSLAWISTDRFREMVERAPDFLHPQELETLGRLKIERRQTSYLLGRLTAKAALAACSTLGFVATKTLISSGVFSQPVVRGPSQDAIGVSISHSDKLVCSIAYPEEHPMAVDVEEVDAARADVMMTQIGAAEADLARAICRDQIEAATMVWTAKEALSKALRCGMTCPYKLLEVCDLEAANSYYAGRFRNFGQYKFQAWRRGSSILCVVLPFKTRLGVVIPDPLS